jgi:predicted dehydrogenase
MHDPSFPANPAAPSQTVSPAATPDWQRRQFLAGSLALPWIVGNLSNTHNALADQRPSHGDQSQTTDEPPTQPLRLALISAASYGLPGAVRSSGSHHGTAFATIFNGWDENHAAQFEGTFVKSPTRLPGARVVKIWDPLPAAAQALAAACSIPEVCPSPAACCQDVDAVILIDDGSGRQWEFAQVPLQQGLPVFCDKPLAMTAAEAQKVARWSQDSGAKLMSASSLRFVPDIVRLRSELESLGDIKLAIATGPGQLVYYGIHALSMVYAVLGGGVRSVLNVGGPGRNCLKLSYHDRDLETLLLVTETNQFPMGYQLQLFGERGSRTVTPDLTDLYVHLLQAFLNYLQTGNPPYPLAEEVELIATLEAGERSLQNQTPIDLQELLGQ